MSSFATKVIEAVTAPLGFFVLALLIVESFLATVLLGADLDTANTVMGMWLGVSLFVLVTVLVFLLVWFKPQHLTYDKSAHLIQAGKAPLGTDSELVRDPNSLEPTETTANE